MYDINTPDNSDFVDHSVAESAVYPEIPNECFETGEFICYADTNGLILNQINEYNAHRNIILRYRKIINSLRLFLCTITIVYIVMFIFDHDFTAVDIPLAFSVVGITYFGLVKKELFGAFLAVFITIPVDVLWISADISSFLNNSFLYLTIAHLAFAFLWETTEKKFSKEKGYPKFLRIIVVHKEGTTAFFDSYPDYQ